MGVGHRLGEAGEALAAVWLRAVGYRIVDRRWRRGGGELDLVAERDGWVVFVEVKTRGPGRLAGPAAGLDGRQRARLRRMAGCWLAENPGVAVRGCRFDLVGVEHEGEGRGCRLLHLPDAF